ncbi:hypothetical protein NDU88_004641 [Pleurodeles waltl]|uniref:Uncharacterized protein n=1 Tax=Pleurodeles waltl TaxID=8319 RepID=A0AAV7LIP8_PLEWA|nr:hypothetical protein NDU88_004641 [Pleurodeles waltl]
MAMPRTPAIVPGDERHDGQQFRDKEKGELITRSRKNREPLKIQCNFSKSGAHVFLKFKYNFSANSTFPGTFPQQFCSPSSADPSNPGSVSLHDFRQPYLAMVPLLSQVRISPE